ncbi:MAG: hypothetical protein ICV61_06345 [Microcoleus sp. Co-bin12]|nr:hypothetical protein [Microcoleus sp. Co-bin12]
MAVAFFRIRATNQFPNSHRVPDRFPVENRVMPIVSNQVRASGYRSAIEDDGDRTRSQSTVWAKILAVRSTF